MNNIIVWDIETVPDLKGFAAASGHVGKSDVRAELGDKFPKHIYHSIICIGALVAHREENGRWTVDALGAPHAGERSEKELIASFVDKGSGALDWDAAAQSPPPTRQRSVLCSCGEQQNAKICLPLGTATKSDFVSTKSRNRHGGPLQV
jgi:hypothetical protein